MKKLNQELLQNGQFSEAVRGNAQSELPEKVLQFGEGNFMRGFIDWMIHQLNKQGLFNGRIVTVQPTPNGKVVPKLNGQSGLYTMALRGIEAGHVVDTTEVVCSISRGINPYTDWNQVLEVASNPDIKVVFSNTTEAGISYVQEDYDPNKAPLSFPGKLTACLFHRFQSSNGDPQAGWSIIPCELIENNGLILKDVVLRIADDWNLSDEFKNWVIQHNHFCNTLVDRIVPGFPKDNIDDFRQQLGYEDELLTVGEPFHLFVIDGDPIVREIVPFEKAGLNVYWEDVRPFRELKVRILNGAHTMMAATAFLGGKQTVLDVMEDADFASFISKGIYEEILPVLDMEETEKRSFANSVLERFRNPFTKHYLLDISLNGVSKFKTRLLPTLKAYVKKNGRLPPRIVFSLAALIVFYKGSHFEGGNLVGKHGEQEYVIRDSEETLHFLYETWNSSNNVESVMEAVLHNEQLWGSNLCEIEGIEEAVTLYVTNILKNGIDPKLV